MRRLDGIIRQMTREEELSFNAIVERYGQMIVHLAYSERKNWHDAEDISQETFLVLAKNIHKVKDYEYIEQWLLRVLEHLVLHYYRNTHSETSWEDVEDFNLIPDDRPIYDDGVESLLDGFPELDKMIFRYLEMGYELRETARMVGISYTYCRVRKNRVKKKLSAEARKRHLIK